jgi:hypothetical protein
MPANQPRTQGAAQRGPVVCTECAATGFDSEQPAAAQGALACSQRERPTPRTATSATSLTCCWGERNGRRELEGRLSRLERRSVDMNPERLVNTSQD